jgi:hypothetical protein
MSWPPDPEIGRRPGFDAAMRTMAVGMLTLGEREPALGGIFKDAGRYVAAMCAAGLQDQGVTLPRLKELCAPFALLSTGRARALLIYLRYLGYVSPWSERRAGGAALYALSPGFIAAWRRQQQVALTAAAVLDPAAVPAVAALEAPVFMARFSRVQMEGLAIGEPNQATAPLFIVFLNRHAGIQILWTLIAQGEGECPSAGPLAVGVGELSARFGVSRMHVRRLLRDAEVHGLLTRLDGGGLAFTPMARAEIRMLYAFQLERLLTAYALTSAALSAA